MIRDIDKAWMAGVIDLKGRLTSRRFQSRRTNRVSLIVETKERLIVQRLSELTELEPEMRDAKPLSEFLRHPCTIHCPEAHTHVIREGQEVPRMGRWVVTGSAFVVVAYNLLPYLQINRGYQEAMTEVLDNQPLAGRGAAEMLRAIKRLRSMGWELPAAYAPTKWPQINWAPEIRPSKIMEVMTDDVLLGAGRVPA